MTVHYSDDWLTVLHGDVRDELRTLPDESVHCVVTSPPYWGLRDYGTATWEGGDPECDHTAIRRPGPEDKSFTNGGTSRDKPRNDCRKCGAVRLDNQLGLEPTPEQYVENMVAVFREVRRVLRPDGTLWLNLGDSYNQTGGGGIGRAGRNAVVGTTARNVQGRTREVDGLKPKDLVGIPWRVAFALQADGWYLRSEIIWNKPNPMPESVTDRPTKSHEQLFLLTKSARYFYDSDAVREGLSGLSADASGSAVLPAAESERPVVAVSADQGGAEPARGGRNLRSVWTIATAPYPGAHFATFPPKLVEPCIKAGTSEKGVCPECGAPWERVVERGGVEVAASQRHAYREDGSPVSGDNRYDPNRNGGPVDARISRIGVDEAMPRATTGWRPTCVCLRRWEAESEAEVQGGPALTRPRPGDPVSATVLDPFAGSGTTGMVAQSLSRRAVLIDLNVDYLGQLMERNRAIPLGLGESA